MISIKSNINVNFKLSKAIMAGVFIIGSAMSTAHGELVIQEKDPSASIINQFDALKKSDAKSPQLQQFVTELTQRLARNPSDSLAWEILAQIYYDNGYQEYAVYAASEAMDLGQSTAKLKKILLNSSAALSQSQLQSGYLTDEVDAAFLKEYQYALSKVYGDLYGFNYDESLPKPPVVRPRATRAISKSKAQPRVAVRKQVTPTKKAVKQPPRQTPKAKPINKPAKPSSPRTSNAKSTDPFSILR